MNRVELTSRYDAAVRRHWRSCMDSSGPTAALVADLAAIAEEHALGAVTREQVSTALDVPPELRQAWDELGKAPAETAGTPPLVAADGGNGSPAAVRNQKPGADVSPLPDPPMQDLPGPTIAAPLASHRTRTRTRGGPK